MTDGTVSVDAGGFVERPNCLGVVEAIHEAYPLIEVPLRRGDARRDRHVVGAEIVEQRYRAAGLSYSGRVVLCECGRREYGGRRDDEREIGVRANTIPPMGD